MTHPATDVGILLEIRDCHICSFLISYLGFLIVLGEDAAKLNLFLLTFSDGAMLLNFSEVALCAFCTICDVMEHLM